MRVEAKVTFELTELATEAQGWQSAAAGLPGILRCFSLGVGGICLEEAELVITTQASRGRRGLGRSRRHAKREEAPSQAVTRCWETLGVGDCVCVLFSLLQIRWAGR